MNLRRDTVENTTNSVSTFDINNLKYEFKVDREKFTVEYGGIIFDAYTQYTAKEVAKYCGMGTGKLNYANFNTKYGITAKVLAKCLNREFMEVLVSPILKHVSRYCFNSINCNMVQVKHIHKVKPILDQCEDDGIENIAPICLLLKANPSECKAKLGKSLWKTLCKNSLTKNVLIYKQATKNSMWDYMHIPTTDIKTQLELLNSFKSKYLKRGNNIRGTEVGQFDKYGLWVNNTGGSYNLARDTGHMSKALNEKFSLKWSPTKMQKMHDRYSLALQKQREEKLLRKQAEHNTTWEAVERYLPCDTIELNGYIATLIKTPLELHREGEAMHHCVGSYASSVKSGDYLVYSITKDGERVSTLGLFKTEVVTTASGRAIRGEELDFYDVVAVDQHYGKHNSKVIEETPLQLANLVVESLNRLMKKH